jgi:pyridoxal phosphate enzyme (YggS family)
VTDPDEVERFARARQVVLDRIAEACARAGRAMTDVELVAVSKTVAADRVRAAVAAGQRTFGENRVQEGVAKVAAIGATGVRWRLIGPLQANKARAAVRAFDAIDAVDSVRIARRVDEAAGEIRPDAALPVLLEVNVDADPSKHGWSPEAVERDLPALAGLPHLRLDGLMTIGRLVERPEDARPTFRTLRRLSERLRRDWPVLGSTLSMGMTDDYPIAVEEGATHVRVGRALFGERPH